MTTLDVYLESGAKRTFACAVEFPGWSRSGKLEDEAIAALLAAGHRYAGVATLAGTPFDVPTGPAEVHVVERLRGGAGTDFGVPSETPRADERDVDGPALDRLVSLLRAAWRTFDDAAERAAGLELRKGPRGGGRDLDKIRGHVLDAERAYCRQLGRRPPSDGTDPMAALRDALVATLRARVTGGEIADPTSVRRPWTPRYLVRRSAWHALDHAWEIEDRAIRA